VIEEHYGRPMDIEWAKDGVSGKLFIVQARPETVKSRGHATQIERYALQQRGDVIAEGRAIGQKIGSGTARVVRSISDMNQVQPGDVLVADGGGQRCGYWGEILAVAAQMRGAVGLVIDGGVRDVDRLAELGFPAFSRYIAVRRTVKLVPGTIGEPIEVGGRPVARGDIVVADVDGVIVLPRDRLSDVTDAAIGREKKETHFLERIRAGESTVDLFGLR